MFRECGELLYGCESWCLKECTMAFLKVKRSIVTEMCGVQLNDRKRSTDLIFMLGLKETIDQLAMAHIVHWYGHVLRREDGYILRRALDYEVDGHRKKARLKRMWKKQIEGKSMKVGLS